MTEWARFADGIIGNFGSNRDITGDLAPPRHTGFDTRCKAPDWGEGGCWATAARAEAAWERGEGRLAQEEREREAGRVVRSNRSFLT